LFDGPLHIWYFLFGSEIQDDKPLQVKSNTGKIFKIDSSMKPMNHLTANLSDEAFIHLLVWSHIRNQLLVWIHLLKNVIFASNDPTTIHVDYCKLRLHFLKDIV
jgi:hypothetical protein